jgi:hypothetical protein
VPTVQVIVQSAIAETITVEVPAETIAHDGSG